MSEGKHTPTPWRIGYAVVLGSRKYPPLHIEPVDENVILRRSGSGGAHSYSREIVTFDGKDDDKANAEFIVRAVNAHEQMKAALASAQSALQQAREHIDGEIDVVDGSYGEPAPNRAMSLAQEIDAALSTLNQVPHE